MNPADQQAQQSAFQRAMTFLKSGDAKMAEEICENALAAFPDDANIMCLSARALLMLRHFSRAEERLNDAITQFPEFARPHVIRGEMHLTQGLLDNAVEDFRRAIALGDTDPNTHLKLGKVLMLQGDNDAAKEAVDESMRLDPDRKLLAEAYSLEQNGKGAEAEKIYRDILVRNPENVEALRLLAGTATSQNQHPDAETLLKRALELTPDFGRALADLIVNQMEQEKTDEAIESAKRLLKIGADNPDSYLLYGNALSAAGYYDEAITAYQKTLEMSQDHPGALSGMGHNLRTVGRHEESIAAYRQCIKAFPYFTESYWSLANLKTFKFTDDEVTAMEGLLTHEHIPDDSKVHLTNALGLEYEGRQNYDKAFEYFRQCNDIKRKQEYYDPVATEDLHDRLIEVFNAEFLAQQPAETNRSATPIFIIGLPRSGSTLLEQILASHSQVEGTHELSDLGRVVNQIPSMLKKKGRYPNSIADIDKDGLTQLGEAYLSRTEKFRAGLEYFSDKNPNNFGQVGLASLILPNAIFINAQRHPLDSCFGSYKQLFAKGNPFSYHLTDLAEFYLQYARLIDHWHAVLPGKILNVRYEDVVEDLDTQVRRILDHCGLPFEEQCLRFHETDRAVQTASSEQVRRPIYSSSVNLWRNYEQYLQPTIDILAPILRDLPEADQPNSL